ncbi:hypothetical protein KAFR_0A01860 [Kazachstania africana CBS 2517]|uniref:C2H2-type domain-containing protein n=1 Tax=Kazachstania africana (strain ATCC 22294 / BCRC 22015 / CBS 2517 / CECT 1963 / NBRC 1671 / NRRL Y-8276) TaxID=1071382 RepID=H2AMM4_KAZAF|nr:hypothetical protein KAFR_0A01860 [Kazachstania africana CBS 2517]CCF55624.1 hypothetical protein KAFR_0A01860 [Kazachstania africana CBS 2517]
MNYWNNQSPPTIIKPELSSNLLDPSFKNSENASKNKSKKNNKNHNDNSQMIIKPNNDCSPNNNIATTVPNTAVATNIVPAYPYNHNNYNYIPNTQYYYNPNNLYNQHYLQNRQYPLQQQQQFPQQFYPSNIPVQQHQPQKNNDQNAIHNSLMNNKKFNRPSVSNIQDTQTSGSNINIAATATTNRTNLVANNDQMNSSNNIANTSPFIYHWGPINTSKNISELQDSNPYSSTQPFIIQRQFYNDLPYANNQRPHVYQLSSQQPLYSSTIPFTVSGNDTQPNASSTSTVPAKQDILIQEKKHSMHSIESKPNESKYRNDANSSKDNNDSNNAGGNGDNTDNSSNVIGGNLTLIHSCHLCEKSFRRKSWLKRHLLSHSTERQFLCPWCLSRHKRKDNLLQHMKLKHSNYLVIELKKNNAVFSCVNGGNREKLNDTDDIRNLISLGVINKDDVKKVINKLIDNHNSNSNDNNDNDKGAADSHNSNSNNSNIPG